MTAVPDPFASSSSSGIQTLGQSVGRTVSASAHSFSVGCDNDKMMKRAVKQGGGVAEGAVV